MDSILKLFESRARNIVCRDVSCDGVCCLFPYFLLFTDIVHTQSESDIVTLHAFRALHYTWQIELRLHKKNQSKQPLKLQIRYILYCILWL